MIQKNGSEENQILQIQQTLSKLSTQLEKMNSQPNPNSWLTSVEACKFLHVTNRCLQNWRDKGILSFSKTGGKILYKFSDLEELLTRNYQPAFNKNGRRAV